MRKFVKFISVVVGSTILALVVCLFVAGVSSSGVALLELTHAFFLVCLAVGVLGSIIATALSGFSVWRVLLSGILTFLLLGGLLYGTNIYLTKKKAEQDAANHPPAAIPRLAAPPSPPVPIVRTPKAWLAPPVNQVTGNGNVTGNTVKGNNNTLSGSVTAGPCSNVQIGGSNNRATTNCVPPPPPDRTLTDTNLAKLQKSLTIDIVPKPKVEVKSIGGDTDMPAFPNQIIRAFSAGGWDVIPIWGGGGGGTIVLTDRGPIAPPQDGLHCAFRYAGGPEVKQIRQAFKNVGLNCERTDDQPEQGGLLMVIIGPKVHQR